VRGPQAGAASSRARRGGYENRILGRSRDHGLCEHTNQREDCRRDTCRPLPDGQSRRTAHLRKPAFAGHWEIPTTGRRHGLLASGASCSRIVVAGGRQTEPAWRMAALDQQSLFPRLRDAFLQDSLAWQVRAQGVDDRRSVADAPVTSRLQVAGSPNGDHTAAGACATPPPVVTWLEPNGSRCRRGRALERLDPPPTSAEAGRWYFASARGRRQCA
jgi:hypothetical protein